MNGEVIGVVPNHLNSNNNNGKLKVVNGGHVLLNGKVNGKVQDNGGLNGHQKTSISIPQLIAKKRDGKEFSPEEIQLLVDWAVNKEMQNSQLGAILMAIYLKGMSLNETIQLTKHMKESGDEFFWPHEWKGLMVDKHSTGGVGDKVSLVLAPILAACGLKVPMISGRGLGFTGGTLDKLESIAGFKVSQSTASVKRILATVGCCIVGQTDTLVPADRIMYAIRDITSTTDSIPLMAASIISKKAAENLSGLVLDVKFGRGAFLKPYRDAQILAKTLVKVSNGQGVKTTAILSNMNNPLGRTVGNAVEVAEAILCLQGEGPQSLTTLVLTLGAQLIYSIGKVATVEAGRQMLSSLLDRGLALEKFCEMLVAQGTAPNLASKLCSKGSDPFLYLPQSSSKTDLRASCSGYVNNIDALACAEVSNKLGAGRTKAGQNVDLAVGLVFSVDVGSFLQKGDVWVTIHHNSELLDSEVSKLEQALTITDDPPNEEDIAMIREVISCDTE